MRDNLRRQSVEKEDNIVYYAHFFPSPAFYYQSGYY
jgi:hypothetical protein